MNIIHVNHPLNNGKIIINYPGADGSIDGYQDKYKKLAEYIVSQKLAAVVRVPNPYEPGKGWQFYLRIAIQYVIDNSFRLCGVDKPNIFLMGTSAGGGAVATIAWEYPEVSKILLLEPAIIYSGKTPMGDSIGKYKGEITIITGDSGDALGPQMGKIFYDAATSASRKERITIPDCDHQFRGEKNGKILSQAPFYAFANGEKPSFPDYMKGIKLYD